MAKLNRPRHQGIIKMPTCGFPAKPKSRIPSIERRPLPNRYLHGALSGDKDGVLISVCFAGRRSHEQGSRLVGLLIPRVPSPSTATLIVMVRAKAKDHSSARTIARQRRAREETAAKRQHLLECARIILREGSIFDLTAISLAEQAGVTRQTVYRYFPNTETIFKALSDQVITQVYEDLQVASEGKDTLDHFVTKAMGVFVADSLVIRQLALASALGRASGRWQQVDPEGILVQIVSDMPEAKRPVSADPAISARMMITYFRGALYGWAAGFYSDEEFEKQVRLASRLSDPDSD